MKLNWGYKILLVYVLFVGGIMYMVYLSSRENKDLVSENYYAEELKYQNVIDQSANTASLKAPIEIQKQDGEIILLFPSEFSGVECKGNWLLYYAADISKDHTGTFELREGRAHISIPQGAHGLYKLKLTWNALGKDFYFEKDISF